MQGMSTTPTLHYLINVGVRLLIFEQNSTQHVLIPYHTFINFGKLFQSSLKNEQKPQFLIVSIENVHIIFINFSTLYYYSIPYDQVFIWTQFSTQYAYSITYVYQIVQSRYLNMKIKSDLNVIIALSFQVDVTNHTFQDLEPLPGQFFDHD